MPPHQPCRLLVERTRRTGLRAQVLALRDDDVVILRTVVHDMTADDDGVADDNPRPRQRRRMEGDLSVQAACAMRVFELHAELTTRGLSTVGLKAALLRRLLSCLEQDKRERLMSILPTADERRGRGSSESEGEAGAVAAGPPADAVLLALQAVDNIGPEDAARYCALLAEHGFTTLASLHLASKDDLKDVGLKLGHALALVHSLAFT